MMAVIDAPGWDRLPPKPSEHHRQAERYAPAKPATASCGDELISNRPKKRIT